MDSVNRSNYLNNLVPLNEGQPPEELLSQVSGHCGRWQISICIVAFISVFMHGCNLFTVFAVAPRNINYTCVDGNGSKCWDVKGKKCKNFRFVKENNLTTYSEKFLLVCENEWKIIWIENCFHIGIILSYLIVGWTSDKCGRKIAAMTFIPLHVVSGALIVMSSNYGMLLCLFSLHGIFSTALTLLPKVEVCETVGNKWRTFALAFTTYPLHLSWIIILGLRIASNVNSIIIASSFLPLILLVPLLYFKNSPTYILHLSDFVKAEIALRQIGGYNKRSLLTTTRIRPVETLDLQALETSCMTIWTSTQTKYAFLALLSLWFILGTCFNIILYYLFVNVTNPNNLIMFGFTSFVSSVFGICLCQVYEHKSVICVFSALKNISILAIFLLIHFLTAEMINIEFICMGVIALCFFWIAGTALDNVTPRMWPTCIRSRGLGMCLGLFHVGCVLVNLMTNGSGESITWLVTAAMVIFLVTEIFLSSHLWNVHNRELPDFIQDATNFKMFYKPQRYLLIDQKQTTCQEIEIKHMNLN